MDKAKDWGLLVARLALGIIFIAHGSQKLFGDPGVSGIAGMLGGMGLKPGIFWAWILALTEFLGGIGVIVGLLTRLAALGLSIVMIVAVATVHGKQGFFINIVRDPADFTHIVDAKVGFEYNLALLGLSVCLLIAGAGQFALGALCVKKKAAQPQTQEAPKQ